MAEPNEPTDPAAAGEEPKTEKAESVATPTDSPEAKPAAKASEESAPVKVSADADSKPASSEAEPAVKPVKKAAKKKKEETAPKVATGRVSARKSFAFCRHGRQTKDRQSQRQQERSYGHRACAFDV
jgi:hypothetical protein